MDAQGTEDAIWKCRFCGWEYRPEAHGGVPFERQPESFSCPGCGTGRSIFYRPETPDCWDAWDEPSSAGRSGADSPSPDALARSTPAAAPLPAIHLPMELFTDEDRYVLSAEMPGVAPERVTLETSGNFLTLAGEKRRAMALEKTPVRGRNGALLPVPAPVCGRFLEEVLLPEDADMGAITADCRDGILTVTIPRDREGKLRHKVPIAR